MIDLYKWHNDEVVINSENGMVVATIRARTETLALNYEEQYVVSFEGDWRYRPSCFFISRKHAREFVQKRINKENKWEEQVKGIE